MALIRVIIPFASQARGYAIGDEAEFTESEARMLVAKGYAEFVEIAPDPIDTPEMRAVLAQVTHEPQNAPKRRGKGKKQ
jgi:hypothetical protein